MWFNAWKIWAITSASGFGSPPSPLQPQIPHVPREEHKLWGMKHRFKNSGADLNASILHINYIVQSTQGDVKTYLFSSWSFHLQQWTVSFSKLSNVHFRAAVIFRCQITSYQMADSIQARPTQTRLVTNRSSLPITAGPTCVGWPHLVSTWTCPYVTNVPHAKGIFSTLTSVVERIKTSVDSWFLHVQLSSNSRLIRPGKTIHMTQVVIIPPAPSTIWMSDVCGMFIFLTHLLQRRHQTYKSRWFLPCH